MPRRRGPAKRLRTASLPGARGSKSANAFRRPPGQAPKTTPIPRLGAISRTLCKVHSPQCRLPPRSAAIADADPIAPFCIIPVCAHTAPLQKLTPAPSHCGPKRLWGRRVPLGQKMLCPRRRSSPPPADPAGAQLEPDNQRAPDTQISEERARRRVAKYANNVSRIGPGRRPPTPTPTPWGAAHNSAQEKAPHRCLKRAQSCSCIMADSGRRM